MTWTLTGMGCMCPSHSAQNSHFAADRVYALPRVVIVKQPLAVAALDIVQARGQLCDCLLKLLTEDDLAVLSRLQCCLGLVI